MANAAIVTVESIKEMAEGRCKASRDHRWFAQLARRGGEFVVETGWIVPEADEDDPGAVNLMPFLNQRKPEAWVGRRVITSDPAEALAVYTAYKENDYSRGEKIGSVHR